VGGHRTAMAAISVRVPLVYLSVGRNQPAVAARVPELQYTRIFGDPLDWVRRRLGHRSVTTAQICPQVTRSDASDADSGLAAGTAIESPSQVP
jgi:hypothetical protein